MLLMFVIMRAHALLGGSAGSTSWKIAFKSFFDDLQFGHEIMRGYNFLRLTQIQCCHVICNFIPHFHWNRMILLCHMIILIISKRIIWGNTKLAETTYNDFKNRKMSNIWLNILNRHLCWRDNLNTDLVLCAWKKNSMVNFFFRRWSL